eukprot:CAMPEP_0203898876 /NCGR_PEP_ID=MMETSP0359-20131031/41361_1 /ASSEMBLY_ACC=CAM_ASM_000338 /TAXON_ID=268821 /ORGANISM="Scrippsiella Hangoei, Strain SHTV-5" /LENGTH=38 /DNA_ID= /DNA_START= /DNA_END= /DNA_ORIENTATION=
MGSTSLRGDMHVRMLQNAVSAKFMLEHSLHSHRSKTRA